MTFLVFLKYFLLVVGSYFMGNISFARIISKLKHGDITKSGSGNPGSMNMLRTYGFKFGILTLLCDALKAVIPALAGQFLFGYGTDAGIIGMYIAGIAVILGHNFPVLYKFKGGKGIACTLGVFLVADPMWLGIFFVAAFLYLWFFDYGAVASLIVITALTIIEGLKHQDNLIICLLLFIIFSMCWFTHRANIVRLLVGKENKANLQKSIKKRLHKQNKTIKHEYKQEKVEAKTEFKQKAEKYKEDKEKYKKQVKKYKQKSKDLKENYKSQKKRYTYASVLEAVISSDETQDADDE